MPTETHEILTSLVDRDGNILDTTTTRWEIRTTKKGDPYSQEMVRGAEMKGIHTIGGTHLVFEFPHGCLQTRLLLTTNETGVLIYTDEEGHGDRPAGSYAWLEDCTVKRSAREAGVPTS